MYIFSCDLGGTYTKWGIFKDGVLVEKGEFESGAALGGKVLLDRLIHKLLLIKEQYTIEGIAISSAGTIDHQTGDVVQASDIIPGYQGMNVIDYVKKTIDLPIIVENDVNCAMYAEAITGVGKESEMIFGLTLGTGVGSAIIINKEIYHGSKHFAGEVGYLNINGEVLDLSGSTRGLAMRVAKRKQDDYSLWNGKRVFEGYFQQDKICIDEIENMAEAIANVISQSICFLNPNMIILGGGVMAQKEVILPLVHKKIHQKLPSNILNATKIEAAIHGNYAGLYGAYYIFINRYQKIHQ